MARGWRPGGLAAPDLAAGVEVNVSNDYGMTPLIAAVQEQHADVAELLIDAGARKAVEFSGGSLLAIGIVKVSGHFGKGDPVAVCDGEGQEFARGLSNYSSDDIRRIRGLKTAEIPGVLGHCPYEEVIHRDNLLVTTTNGG